MKRNITTTLAVLVFLVAAVAGSSGKASAGGCPEFEPFVSDGGNYSVNSLQIEGGRFWVATRVYGLDVGTSIAIKIPYNPSNPYQYLTFIDTYVDGATGSWNGPPEGGFVFSGTINRNSPPPIVGLELEAIHDGTFSWTISVGLGANATGDECQTDRPVTLIVGSTTGTATATPTSTSTATVTTTPDASYTATPGIQVTPGPTGTPATRREFLVSSAWMAVGDVFTATLGVYNQRAGTRVQLSVPPGIQSLNAPDCETGTGCIMNTYFANLGANYSTNVRFQALEGGQKTLWASFREDGVNIIKLIPRSITIQGATFTATVTPTPGANYTPTPIPTVNTDQLIPIVQGWNNIIVPLEGATAEAVLQSMEAQGVDAPAIAVWRDGRWTVHIRGLSSNDFALRWYEGNFVRSRNAGSWYPLLIPPLPAS